MRARRIFVPNARRVRKRANPKPVTGYIFRFVWQGGMINPTPGPCDEAAIRSVPSSGVCAPSAKPWVLLATILGSGIANIDGSIVNVALPAIETDLATSVEVIQWLVNAYTLCLSAFLLTGGAAGDLFGRRRVFLVGIAIFATASLWCGLSPNIAQLILARAIQGTGAALLIPCSLAIIGATFDESERGKAIGTWRVSQPWRQPSDRCWVDGSSTISPGAGFSSLLRCSHCRQSGSRSTNCRRAAMTKPGAVWIGAGRCLPLRRWEASLLA